MAVAGQVEDGLDVDREDFVPRVVRVLVERSGPVGPRVVDENVEFFLAAGDLGGELLAGLIRRQVRGQ